MSLNAKLVVVGGEIKTAEIKLKLPSSIGRGRGTTIMLPHPLVSRQHCELFEANGKLMVRDLGSLNGTFVNNERITEAPIASGELLTVGTVTFRAVYDDVTDNGPPPGVAPATSAKNSPARTSAPSETPSVPPNAAKTVRVFSDPVDLDDIDELGEDLDFESSGSGQQAVPFIASAKAKSADKTDTLEDAVDFTEDDSAPPPAAQLIKPAPGKQPAPASKPAPLPAKPAAAVKGPAPTPAKAPAAAPAKVAATPPAKAAAPTGDELDADSDAAEEAEDLNDFLKSLGK